MKTLSAVCNPFFYFSYPAVTGSRESMSDLSLTFSHWRKVFWDFYSVMRAIYFGEKWLREILFFFIGIWSFDCYVMLNEQVLIVTSVQITWSKSMDDGERIHDARRVPHLLKLLDNNLWYRLIFPPWTGKTGMELPTGNWGCRWILIDDKHENNFPGASEN